MSEISLEGKGAESISRKWDRIAEDFGIYHSPGVVFLALAFDRGLGEEFAALLEPYREMDGELSGLSPEEAEEKVAEFFEDGRL